MTQILSDEDERDLNMHVFPMDSITADTPDAELRHSYCVLCDARLSDVKERGACPDTNARKQCQWSRHFRRTVSVQRSPNQEKD